MLRPILIVLFVTLAKLHCGTGGGPNNPLERSRYGSFRRFPGPSVTAPAPAPAPAPASSPPPPSSLRTQPSLRSSRFSNAGAPQQQQSSSGLTQGASFKADSPATVPAQPPSPRGRRFSPMPSTASQPQRSQAASGVDAEQNFPPGLFNALSRGGAEFPLHGPLIPDLPPGMIMVQVGPDGKPIGPIPDGYSLQGGGPVDIDDYLENERRKEEEADPLNHQINTEGEIIEQQLPGGGGDIVIKIFGTNITQKKMNKLRKMMENSISFVFENVMSKSGIMARFM